MSNQEKLYRHDFRPVYRSLPSQPEWQPLKQSVQFLSTPSSEGGGRAEQFSIRFAHKVESSNETLYFAFCYPHGYAETTAQLAWLDAVFRLPQAHVSPPVAPYLLRLPETWFQAIVDWLPSWLGGSGGRAVRPPHLTPEAAETATTTTSDAAARSPPRPPQAESGTGRPSFFPPWGSVSPSSRAVTTAEERLAVQRFARARLRSVAHAAALEASVSSRALGDASKTARALGTSSGSAASIAMARPLAPHQPDGEGGAFLQGARLAAEMQRVHAELAAAAVASADAHLPQSAPKGVYYRRELLSRSLEGRRIDMLTITAEGAPDEEEREEDALPAPLLPEGGKRPRRFPGRRYILVTSRVHPGETPSSHVLNGLIAFLLQVDDPRARALRAHFVFKIIPILNPDGVYHGHYRYDTRGVNLNRKYASATFEAQPAVYASMAVARQLHEAGMLHMVLDLHAHAGKRGCFFYGNQQITPTAQVDAALFMNLCAFNTRWLDLNGCTFFGLGSHDGSARSAMYRLTGLPLIFTLECNYNRGHTPNELPRRHLDPTVDPGSLSPEPQASSTISPKYDPALWRDIGKALGLAALEMGGLNPASRLGPSARRDEDLRRVRSGVAIWATRMQGQPAVCCPSDDDDDDNANDPSLLCEEADEEGDGKIPSPPVARTKLKAAGDIAIVSAGMFNNNSKRGNSPSRSPTRRLR